MTDEPREVKCSKCGQQFIQTETRSCTSLNNFHPVCPKCQSKKIKENMNKTIKDLFSIFKNKK